jgi:hypothetical protein
MDTLVADDDRSLVIRNTTAAELFELAVGTANRPINGVNGAHDDEEFSSDWSEAEFLRNEQSIEEEERRLEQLQHVYDKSASFYGHGFEEFLADEDTFNHDKRLTQSYAGTQLTVSGFIL